MVVANLMELPVKVIPEFPLNTDIETQINTLSDAAGVIQKALNASMTNSVMLIDSERMRPRPKHKLKPNPIKGNNET